MAEMEIELSELESELVHHGRIEILGKRRAIWENGTDFKVLMRGPPSRVEPVIGWARDIDLVWCAGASEEEMDAAKTLDPELGPRLNETEATVGTADSETGEAAKAAEGGGVEGGGGASVGGLFGGGDATAAAGARGGGSEGGAAEGGGVDGEGFKDDGQTLAMSMPTAQDHRHWHVGGGYGGGGGDELVLCVVILCELNRRV